MSVDAVRVHELLRCHAFCSSSSPPIGPLMNRAQRRLTRRGQKASIPLKPSRVNGCRSLVSTIVRWSMSCAEVSKAARRPAVWGVKVELDDGGPRRPYAAALTPFTACSLMCRDTVA